MHKHLNFATRGIATALLIAAPSFAQTSWVQSPLNGNWYRLTAAQSWTAAEAEAVRDGGHLATVRSLDEHNWLVGQFGNRELWIGLNDAAVEGTFAWSSGEGVVYRNWCSNEPNDFSGMEDYVHIAGWCIDQTGGWNDQDDGDSYPGIVEVASRPDGWVQSPVNGHWYRRTAPTTWSDAEGVAQREGGHLATVRSQQEQDWLVNQFGSGPGWIGLNDRATEGTFVWSSGEAVGFTAWCAGQPDGGVGDDFVLLDMACAATPGAWNDVDGATTAPGLIERTAAPGSGFSAIGTGCAGALSMPSLDAVFGSQLLVGGRFDLEMTGVAVNPLSVPFGLIGFDDQDWDGRMLPFDLTIIGMTGCSIFIEPEFDQTLPRAGGTAEWSVYVPADNNLIGINVFFQGLVLEPGTNAFGAVLSNAGRATIGG